MNQLKSILLSAILAIFTLGVVSHPAHSKDNTLINKNAGCNYQTNSQFESRVAELINEERAKEGLAPLAIQSQLTTAARLHSADMACNNFFSHTGSDGSSSSLRVARQGYIGSYIGENIAAGYSTPESTVNAWMNSSGHRANILNVNYIELGVGYVYRSGSPYGAYWTNAFARPSAHTISGKIDSLENVILSYQENGNTKTVATDLNGNYTITVPRGWSGTITPSKSDYLFTPENRTYTNITSNQQHQDYSGTTYDSYEPDNTWQDAKWLYSDTHQTRNIFPANDVDWVKFSLAVPSAILLQTNDLSDPNIKMRLYNNNLIEIDFNNDVGHGDLRPIIRRTCTSNPLPAGTYYAKIESVNNAIVISSYTLSLNSRACPSASIDVKLANTWHGSYLLGSATNEYTQYPSENKGPALIDSDQTALANMRVLFAGVSYSEMMGFPASQVTNAYIFPWYNNVAMNSQLRVSNLGDVATTISVYLGDDPAPIHTYTLGAGQASRRNYAGRNAGPLRVESSNTDILATIRVVYAGNSYSELMGYPVNQLTNAYLFPWYNNVAMNSQLRVSNLGNQTTTIRVYLGDDPNPIHTYNLGAGQASRRNYTERNSGPLRVVSSTTDILSTIRVVYADNSYSELMGFPANQLAQEYWYPAYDNVNLNSQLRISNVGDGPTTITVYFGNEQIHSFTLQAGVALRRNYAGRNGGPLRVVSSDQPIMSTVRTVYGGGSYYEMTGLPASWLSTQYWFPWYNNAAMESELRIAVP
jgi:uncharacterized protein YkwD